ncbi:MAG: glycogen debranching protein GlgX [Anaerolinea sp.]
MPTDVFPGKHYPLGPTVYPDGVNFCVFSKNCTRVELLFFDDVDAHRPSRVIELDPVLNRTFYYWHVFVRGVGHGQIYAYRVYGRFEPEAGLRFDGSKVLLDPYARAVVMGRHYDRSMAQRYGVANVRESMKCMVADVDNYDWEEDKPLNLPYAHSIIYEMHVGGFTKHPNSGLPDDLRGTYLGVIEKIPYLQQLGITTVELLPVYQFDPYDAPPGRINYWGYAPVNFFAPHTGYSASGHPLDAINEFRQMVKALHRAGIEVVLDVVFNHSAEGNHEGPTQCFRGLENRAYYMLEPSNRAFYANFSGTGNTLNVGNSIVRRMILDSLRYWVSEMHVDGFRFDLASALTRDEAGRPLASPPLIWEIDSEPILAGAKLIAEAWDAGGLYQVGSFVGDRWAEWNGKFRDDVRRFVKGDENTVPALASRIVASPDIYHPSRDPNRSINFVTAHDGFTLNDLVSYNHKHNLANGEDNRDGTDANYSWNCGVEGPTDDPEIEALRVRQIKNFLTLLLLAQGTPMLVMGDEVRRTQHGNNNAYCHDSELSWFDWSAVERERELLRFTQNLIRLKRSRFAYVMDDYLINNGDMRLTWHGVALDQPDWSPHSRSLAVLLQSNMGSAYLMINAYWEALAFELPSMPWYRLIDTALASPNDFCPPADAPRHRQPFYHVEPRSIVMLVNQRRQR